MSTRRATSRPDSSQLQLFAGPRVKIAIFEGPLDLLLHLVRRQEVDVHEIRVAEITSSFLHMLQTMAELRIEVGGEFVVLASSLCLIKSRLLLPADEAEMVDDEELLEDPQEELARRLAEYRTFKEAAESLAAAQEARQRIFVRSLSADAEIGTGSICLGEVSVFEMVAVFQDLLARAEAAVDPPRLRRQEVTVGERIADILELLAAAREPALTFYDLVLWPTTRLVVVVTFLAVLELIRRGRLRLSLGAHGQILVGLRTRGEAAAVPAQLVPAAGQNS